MKERNPLPEQDHSAGECILPNSEPVEIYPGRKAFTCAGFTIPHDLPVTGILSFIEKCSHRLTEDVMNGQCFIMVIQSS